MEKEAEEDTRGESISGKFQRLQRSIFSLFYPVFAQMCADKRLRMSRDSRDLNVKAPKKSLDFRQATRS